MARFTSNLNDFTFSNEQYDIIKNGYPAADVKMKGLQPNFTDMGGASNLRGRVVYNMPSTTYVDYDVDGTKFSFLLKVDVDHGLKCKEARPGTTPLPANYFFHGIKYHQGLRINCSSVTNGSMMSTMYVRARIAAVKSREEKIKWDPRNPRPENWLESHIVLECSLRTAYAHNLFIGGDFSDKRWDKTVKYVQIPFSAGNGGRLKVTEGISF